MHDAWLVLTGSDRFRMKKPPKNHLINHALLLTPPPRLTSTHLLRPFLVQLLTVHSWRCMCSWQEVVGQVPCPLPPRPLSWPSLGQEEVAELGRLPPNLTRTLITSQGGNLCPPKDRGILGDVLAITTNVPRLLGLGGSVLSDSFSCAQPCATRLGWPFK